MIGPPRKRFGQHFLQPVWIGKVVDAIAPQANETFVEIGPGRGALTHPLAARAKVVLAFEIDRDLVVALRHDAPANLTVIEGDFLDAPTVDHHLSPLDSFRVAGNLAYNVASPILFKLAHLHMSGVGLRDATVMLQREVADRLLAQPGSREYGVLSVLLRHTATVQRLLSLPRGAFRPVPKVQSTLVRLRFHPPDPPVRDEAAFTGLVRAVFSRRRKIVANALLADAQFGRRPLPRWLDPRRRPETLTIDEFARLTNEMFTKP